MNYLAHLFLSEQNSESLLGNLLGDFVKGKNYNNLSDSVIKGIDNHRIIDKFTDSHQSVILSKNLISKERKRFSGIIIDIFYDYFLIKNWSTYTTCNLNETIAEWYDLLEAAIDKTTPQKAINTILTMKQENWLLSYHSAEGIAQALTRVSNRIRYQNNLIGAENELLIHGNELEQHFKIFFPDLISHVNTTAKIKNLKDMLDT
ncbi:Acyl carrier protein phosphodiesterase [hydrothermal vent metagenome]|uniref:Acyl carrier protein phosphodiesterase n=1 Tax=hydrothermal vent metagenome TaxID=652676 RepID=A0A3B0WNK4_9ZZZZ